MRRFRPGNGSLVPIIILSTVAIAYWILYPDPHDPTRISAAASVAVAAATLILAVLTWRSVKISREHIEIQRRPILVPQSPPWDPQLSPWGSDVPPDLARMAGSPQWLANTSDVQIRLRNVGPGAALHICGVLMLRRHAPQTLPERFSIFGALPLAPGDSREIIFREGGTLFTEQERIGGIPLGVPQEEEKIARLTLTWRDEAGLKHAAVFDLDHRKRWLFVGFRHEIPEDLWDMDEKKRREIRWAARLSRLSAFMRRLQFLLRPRRPP
jgi:hypothetical protein